MLVAIGVGTQGIREIPSVAEGVNQDGESWTNFLQWMDERGLKGVNLFISEQLRLVESAEDPGTWLLP
jgi:transposase-like protein